LHPARRLPDSRPLLPPEHSLPAPSLAKLLPGERRLVSALRGTTPLRRRFPFRCCWSSPTPAACCSGPQRLALAVALRPHQPLPRRSALARESCLEAISSPNTGVVYA